MTPKEKADELINGCMLLTPVGFSVEDCKKLALITAINVLDTLYEYHYDSQSGAYEFWKEVKSEIEAI